MARLRIGSNTQHHSKIPKPSRRLAPETLEENQAVGARVSRVTATDAKNEFGRVLESVIRGGRVFITKHDTPKAVLISVDEFETLTGSAGSKLDALSGEFDALLARMQAPEAPARMKAAFDASPKQLGTAAVRFARKRG